MSDEWEKCPRCHEDRKDDWWVPDAEWKRYVPQKWWVENLCVSCYLFLVRLRIQEEGQGFTVKEARAQGVRAI